MRNAYLAGVHGPSRADGLLWPFECLAEELPQVIEIVDGEEKIKALLPTLNE